MKKTFSILLIALAAASLTAASGCKKASGAKKTIRIASVLPEDHPSSQALRFFQQRLEDEAPDDFKVVLFFNSQLGSDQVAARQTQDGNIQAVFISAATLSQFSENLNALYMPFIYRDAQHMYAVWDGPVGKKIGQGLEPIKLRLLCYFDAGSRNIQTKKGPITKPGDLAGMKIRVMPSDLAIDTVNALGASSEPMNQGDVYSALQTGRLDGWENNAATTVSFKMYETGCKNWAQTEHLSVPDVLAMNKAFYDGLSSEQRATLEKVVAETVQQQRKLWDEGEAKSLQQLKDAGMMFNEVDRQAFFNTVQGVYEKYYNKFGPDFKQLCQDIQAVE